MSSQTARLKPPCEPWVDDAEDDLRNIARLEVGIAHRLKMGLRSFLQLAGTGQCPPLKEWFTVIAPSSSFKMLPAARFELPNLGPFGDLYAVRCLFDFAYSRYGNAVDAFR